MSAFFDKLLTLLMAAGFCMLGAASIMGTLAMIFIPGSKNLPDIAFLGITAWMFFTASKMGGEQ